MIRDLHELNHCGSRALYDTLRARYYWRGMRLDCEHFVSKCPQCQAESAHFRGHEQLHPCRKTWGPLAGWAVDLAVGLPQGTGGQTICAVAIDVCTKFAVVTPLLDKSAATLASWLYANVITEYGVP